MKTVAVQHFPETRLAPGRYIPMDWPPLKSPRARKSTKPPAEAQDELPTIADQETIYDLLKRMNKPNGVNSEAKVVLVISDVRLRNIWKRKLILSGVPEEVIVVINDPNDFDPKDPGITLALFDTDDESSMILFHRVQRTSRNDIVCTLIGDHKTGYRYCASRITAARLNENETPKVICRTLHEELMDIIAEPAPSKD